MPNGSFDEHIADDIRLRIVGSLTAEAQKTTELPSVAIGGVAGAADFAARLARAADQHEITDGIKQEYRMLFDYFFDEAMKGLADG